MARRIVEDVMTHQPVSVLEGTSFKEIVRLLAGNHIDLLPVVDRDRRVVGVVTTSDLLARFGARMTSRTHHKHGSTAKELMTTPVVTTTPHADLEDAARLAVHERVPALPVVNQFGTLLGILTLTDIATLFLRADVDIARDVSHELSLRPASADSVSVAVREGVVTLTGTVPTSADARRLLEVARRVPAVVAVQDELECEHTDVRAAVQHVNHLVHQKGARS
jgi:CBS domain-containing protein